MANSSLIISLYVIRYADALWKAYGAKLEDNLNYELQWDKPGGHKSNIGSLDFCSSGALMEFTKSVGHAASKGITFYFLFLIVVSRT